MQKGTLMFLTMLLQLLSLHGSRHFSTKKLLGLKKVKKTFDVTMRNYDGAEICWPN